MHMAKRPPNAQPIRYAYQKPLGNRLGRTKLALGIAPPIYALLETTCRRTGKPRRTPVGNGLVKGTNTFWLVSEAARGDARCRSSARPRRFFGDQRDLLTIRIVLDAPPQRRSWLAPR